MREAQNQMQDNTRKELNLGRTISSLISTLGQKCTDVVRGSRSGLLNCGFSNNKHLFIYSTCHCTYLNSSQRSLLNIFFQIAKLSVSVIICVRLIRFFGQMELNNAVRSMAHKFSTFQFKLDCKFLCLCACVISGW